MADYDITAGSVAEAAALLRNVLQTEIPNGDFTEGSVAADLIVDGHAVAVAYLRKQLDIIRARQSLLTLQNLPDSESVSDAADAILDNFFRTRNQGQFAKGVVTLHFSARADVLVPRTARFFKTSSLVFYVDSASDVLIPASDLRAEIGANGAVISYATTIFLTAARVGEAYNIAPGRFVSFDRFSSLLMSVENPVKFSDGSGVQSTPDFINRSTNAISLRALINARSNDALLLDTFTDVEQTATVGYGDPEMVRDLVDTVSNGVQMHVGGCMDIFVRQPVQEVVERLQIAAPGVRNDGKSLTLRHPGRVPTFLAAGVSPGDVLTITAGLTEFQYKIADVTAYALTVETRTPFPEATDEAAAPVAIGYAIGNNFPAFDNKAVTAATTAAATSRLFTPFNGVVLPGRPTYLIRRVELLPPIPPELAGFSDPATGTVDFTARKNSPLTGPPASVGELGYKVSIANPAEAQSARAVAVLSVGWPLLDLSGLTLEVTYESISNFASVDAYVSARLNRAACANSLVRAPHPVYLYATIPYRPRTTPASSLSTVVPVFDAVAAQAALTTFINTYRETEPLDVSLLATQARAVSIAVASIYNFTLTYQFYLPDGRVMTFDTQDKITIFPDGVTSSATLRDPASFGLPTENYFSRLKALLVAQGVSDRTTRYRASADSVVFEQRS